MPCMGTSVKEADRRKQAAERRRKQMQLMQESKEKKEENTHSKEQEEKREVQTENEQRRHHGKENTKVEKALNDRKENSKKENTTTSKVSNKRSSSSSSLSPQRLPVLVHEQSYYSNVAESRRSKERSDAKREVEKEEESCNSRVSTSVKTDVDEIDDVDGGKHNTDKNKNMNNSDKTNSNDVNVNKDQNINTINNLENPADRERLMQQMLQQALQLNEMLEHELQDARQKLKDSPATNTAMTNSSSFTSSSSSSALIHKPHKSKAQDKSSTKNKEIHKLSSQGQAQTPRVTICETPSQRSLSAKRENSKQLGKFNNNNNNTETTTNNSTTYTTSENDPEALLQRAIREKWSNDEILCKAREAVEHCPPKEAMNTLQILRDVYLLRCKHMAHAIERDARKRRQSNTINRTTTNNNVHSHSPRALSYPVATQNGTYHLSSNKDIMNSNKQTDKIRNDYYNNNIENDKHNYYQTRLVEPRPGKFANDYANRKQVNGNQTSYYRSQSAYVPRNSYRDDAEYLASKRYEPHHESSHHLRNSKQNRNYNNYHHHRYHHHSSPSYPHHHDTDYQRYAENEYTHPSSPYRHYHSEPRQRKSYDDLLQLHSPSYRNNTAHAKYNNVYRPTAHAPAAAERFHRTTHLPNVYELDKNTNLIDSSNDNIHTPYVVRNGLSASQTDIIAALENGYVSQAKRVLAWLEQKVNE